MTLRVALVLDGDAQGASQATENVRSQFERMVSGIDAASRRAAQSFQKIADGAKPTAEVVKLNAAQMQNMAFQMNDMATMLASGQSPFVLMMQQGMQVAQIFGPGTGVVAALKASGAAAAAFATNPLTLAVLGLAAAAGGAKLLWNAVSGSEEAEAALERHNELVDEAKRRYVEAGGKAKEWLAALEKVSLFDARENEKRQKAEYEAIARVGMGLSPVGAQSSLDLAVLMNAAQFSPGALGNQAREVFDLNRQMREQMITVVEYRAELERIGNTTGFDLLIRAVTELREKSKEGLKEFREWQEASRALQGIAGERDLAIARGNLIGSLNARGAASRDFNFAFGDDDKEAKRAADRHINDLKRLAEEWNERASPAAENYMREIAKLAEAQPYFESQAAYLRANTALQKEMNEAIEEERRARLDAATDLSSGIQRALEDYTRRAQDAASSIEDLIKDAFKGAEEAVVEFTQTGKVNFNDLTRSILADLTRMSVRQGITGPLASGLSDAFNFMLKGFQFHSGYGPGDAMQTRLIPAAAFAGAPRYHSGIGPGERAAVLRDDESVLTPGQMRAIGNRETVVRIELVDAQGTPVRGSDGGRRKEGGIDVQRLVVGAAAEDVIGGGPLARSIETTYGLSRRTR